MLIAKKHIGTSLEKVNRCVEWFEKFVKENGIDESAVIVFNELLLNAYEHGNLGINGEEKDKWIAQNIYEKKLRELEEKINKKILIEIHIIGNYLVVKIEDEGKGFKKYKKNFRFCGRGILISKKFADIFYNEKGNKVCFFIKLKRRENGIQNRRKQNYS